MAKSTKPRERAHAQLLFVKEGRNRKDIAKTVGVSEKTVGRWAKEGNWETIRTAHLGSMQTRKENIRDSVTNLSEMLLDYQSLRKQAAEKLQALDESDSEEVQKQRAELREEIAQLDKSIFNTSNAIAAVSKEELRFDKENKITFNTYLNVMENIFNALHDEDPDLYMKTLDFQETHVQTMAKKIG